MKNLLSTAICALLVGASSHLFAQDGPVSAPPSGDFPMPEWTWLDEAVAEAVAEDKKIMIFVYADWCGWCQRLDRQVFAKDEIRAYLDTRFKAVRLNGESEQKSSFQGHELTHIELSRAFGTTGYPNTVFLTSEGEYITRLPGFLPADEFLDVLRYIGEDAYQNQSFEEFSQRD